MSFRILAINPGSTSSKIAVYCDDKELLRKTIMHDAAMLAKYSDCLSQQNFREKEVVKALEEAGIPIASLDAVVGRGGYMKPLISGTYIVDDAMINDLENDPRRHESVLGAVLAYKIAQSAGITAYVVDPVTVNEAEPIARISGLKGIERENAFHVLSHKEVGRRAAEQIGKPYEQSNMIIAHIGGGSSIAAHKMGRAVDSTSGERNDAAFTGKRPGRVPLGRFTDMLFEKHWTKEDVYRILMKEGGMLSYLGTDDGIEVEKRILNGDKEAELIYKAMAYQHAKEIGEMAVVLSGKVDVIALTGGLIFSEMFTRWIEDWVSWIAPVLKYPGECEMEAMIMGTLLVLQGKRQPKRY